MGKINIDQSHQVITTLVANVNWEKIDFKTSRLQDLVVRDPKGAGARFTAFLKNGARMTNDAALPRLMAWYTFRIGGVDAKALLKRVEAQFFLGDLATDLMKSLAFTTQDTEEGIETIILTPADFGYERNPTTTELFNPNRLLEWSKQNAARLRQGCVVELLPAEAGPHIRDQYKDQPKGEVLWIAMERMTAYDGSRCIFRVGRDLDGEQWLGTSWADHRSRWHNLDRRFVFRLRKVA